MSTPRSACILLLLAGLTLQAGCTRRKEADQPLATAPQSSASDGGVVAVSPRELILLPHAGDSPLDQEITALQGRIAAAREPALLIERLGRLFIAKARMSSDPGFYKLAEQCAALRLTEEPDAPEPLLLRGHVLESLHRFQEAEAIARRLVALRENFLDHALLGDSLMEQGRLDEAIAAYQRMIDLRPGMQSYCRVAHVRWLKGDRAGALELMAQAVRTGSARDPEPMAWAYARLAVYQLENTEIAPAHRSATRALELLPRYAPALLARGRIFLAEEKWAEAVATLEPAAAVNPLPEYLWALAEAFHANGQGREAAAVENRLSQRGAVDDPRTFSLYLATRGERPADALKLARAELATRGDVFTHDAAGWASFAGGDLAAALHHSARALGEGTDDARMLLHAGVIAAAAGQTASARTLLARATARRQMLLPSERTRLEQQVITLSASAERPWSEPAITRTSDAVQATNDPDL